MTKHRRLIEWRLIPLLLLCFVNSLWADTFGLFTYTDNGTSITITDYPTTESGAVVIPDTIVGKPVTAIGNSAFFECAGLTSITIPSTVTSIGSDAFRICSNLTSIVIPSGVTSIGGGAFRGCRSLVSITIPAGVTTINSLTFHGCRSLSDLTISGPITSIGSYAFYRCVSLADFTIPPSVVFIESYAFQECSKLTTIDIPSSVIGISADAFEDCTNLTEINVSPLNAVYSSTDGMLFNKSQTTLIKCPGGKTGTISIPASVTSMWSVTFLSSNSFSEILVDPSNTAYSSTDGILFTKSQNSLIKCPGRKTGNISIPSTVTTIRSYAFDECYSLTGITFSPGVLTIQSYAFNKCSSLTSIALPSTVSSIGISAFRDCSSLASISIPSTFGTIAESVFQGCRSLTSFTLPSRTSTIGISAFRECTSLTSITIPSNVRFISESAFRDCVKLETVALQAGLTDIGVSAFSGCINLANITIPPTVTSIRESAFISCYSLTSITIPASVTAVSTNAFLNCHSLTSITVDPLSAYYSSVDGVLYDKNQIYLLQCPSNKTGAVVIPPTVTAILGFAFTACRSLTHVSIPASVTRIDNGTFTDCDNLEAITVDPLNEKYLSDNGLLFDKAQTALYQCPGGKSGSIAIPSTVTFILSSALHGCGNLTEITVDPLNPNFSTADGILFDKTQTTLIQCPGGKTDSVTIPASVTTIGSFAFSDCVGLTGVTIPSGVTQLASSAFLGCVNLSEISIPASVVSIGSSVFDGCRGLTSILIPSSVTSIGSYAFRSCESLSEFTVAPSNTAFSSADGILFNKDQSTLIQFPGAKAGNISIPPSVKSIGDYAFYDCDGITHISIPSSVTGIGTFVFRESDNLASAVFLGDAPGIWGTGWFASFGANASNFTVYRFNDKLRFSSPSWMGYPVVNMGETSALPPWLISNGLPHDTDITTDPDGDSVNFLMAYALALDPKQNLTTSIPRPSIVGNQMSLLFYAGAAGISYRVETSDNLKNWSDENVVLSTRDANGYRTASHPGSGSNRFMRLAVSY